VSTIDNKPAVGGWCRIRNAELIEAIDKAGIATDKLRSKRERWVPRWVVKSHELYQQHLKVSGETTYAGMELAEFLNLTRP
jgi:hypothetical protein